MTFENMMSTIYYMYSFHNPLFFPKQNDRYLCDGVYYMDILNGSKLPRGLAMPVLKCSMLSQ
jgi:hypothetical protein